MLAEVSPDRIAERLSVFAAYFLPGGVQMDVADSITPINAIRLVLRLYFDADTPRLEDASYWSAWARPYDFMRVR